MDIDSLVQRINELARKHKNEGLTEEETQERDRLRQIYLGNVRKNFRAQLDSIEWVEDKDQNNNGKLH